MYRLLLFCLIASTSLGAQSPGAADTFWMDLSAYCGKAFAGRVLHAPEGDTLFRDKSLVMHVRYCDADSMRIPFHVGEDHSRTWVLTRSNGVLTLRHDHRHRDGSEDAITQYGGTSTNSGNKNAQFFPADQHTASIIPPAAANVWWITLDPENGFTYHLRRLGTDRYFAVQFDLNMEVPLPPDPW